MPIEIDCENAIWTVRFLADGEHIVSGGIKGKIQCWRVSDGKEVGEPMDAGRAVYSIAVSQDGKWIVSGLSGGKVVVWNAETREKVNEFQGHDDETRVVDISPDGTKMASGADDWTVCVWSLPTGQRLLGPLEHDEFVIAVNFSPDGRLIATAAHFRYSVRVYDSQDGKLLVEFPLQDNLANRESLTWASDSKQFFTLSRDGNIYCLDVSTKAMVSKWAIHSNTDPICISLSSNGSFIAASNSSSISFWDTTTHNQIGPLIQYPERFLSMALSGNYNIVTASVNTKITLQSLVDTVPSLYIEVHVSLSASYPEA